VAERADGGAGRPAGGRTGRPRRIEMGFHDVGGEIYITGMPGPRDWFANMMAESRFTLHLKESVRADLEARSVPITDREERRRLLTEIVRNYPRQALEQRIAGSPLVRVDFE